MVWSFPLGRSAREKAAPAAERAAGAHDAHVRARVEARAALANEDVAGLDQLWRRGPIS